MEQDNRDTLAPSPANNDESSAGAASNPPADGLSAGGFVGAVFKFSISTYVNFIIYGVAILLTGIFIPPEINAPVDLFFTLSLLTMNIAILGLDQSYIRFFHEKVGSLSKKDLFGICLSLSALVLLILSLFGVLLFPAQLTALSGLPAKGYILPALFLNAFFLMLARYFNVAYRMEQNMALFTAESVLSQFFSKLFLLVGFFVTRQGDDAAGAMIAAGVVGMGAFVAVFTFLRRKTLLPGKGAFQKDALGQLVPYGLALAPTAVLLYLNSSFSKIFVQNHLGSGDLGLFSFAVLLSNVVTVIQAGFATFWGAYVFANYRTQQRRIARVHDFLNLLILVFFAALVAFENVLFFFLPKYRGALPIFPVLMLGAVFTILSEGTVYGIAIARRPVFDTLGIALALVSNIALSFVLVPRFGLMGAAAALSLSSFAMFAFRTLIAQRFYPTVDHPAKTGVALGLAVGLAVFGAIFWDKAAFKFLVSLGVAGVYCLLYKRELARLWRLAMEILAALGQMFARNKTGLNGRGG